MQYWRATCIILLISVVLQGSMAANAQERRIQAVQETEATQLTELGVAAGALGTGEMLILVNKNGTPTILVKDSVCGECNIMWDHLLDDDIYKVDFFGAIEDLLGETTGRRIESLTDIFVIFESGVSEEIALNYRTVFRRYTALLSCCSEAQSYSCCPSTLNTYFQWENALAATVDTNPVVDFTDLVHVVKARIVTSIKAIVVSDGSLDNFSFGDPEPEKENPSFLEWLFGLFTRNRNQDPPSLVGWLRGKLPSSHIHSLDLDVLANGETLVTSEEPAWALSPSSIVLAIAVYDAPDANAPAIKAAVERAILQAVGDRQDDPLIMLFVVPDPSTAMIEPGLSTQVAFITETGTVFVSATSQHADLLKETLDTLLGMDLRGGSVTVDSLTDILRPLGLLAYIF